MQQIPLLPKALSLIRLYQDQIAQATKSRDELVHVIAETQLSSVDGYTLSISLGAEGGVIIATPKAEPQPVFIAPTQTTNRPAVTARTKTPKEPNA